MQIVFQDPFASLNRRKTLTEIIAGPMIVPGGARQTEDRRSRRDLFDLVGLPQAMPSATLTKSPVGSASASGSRGRLRSSPSFVILDEAVSSLDVSVRSQILNLLRRLQRDLGLTYMFVSHDLAVIRYMADTLAVMYAGRIVERGPREQLFGMPQHPYTHALMGAIPVPDPERERAKTRVLSVDSSSSTAVQAGCRYAPRCPIGRSLELCATVDPPLAESGEATPWHAISRRRQRAWLWRSRRGVGAGSDGGAGPTPARRPPAHRHPGRDMNRTLDVALLFDVEDVFHPPEVGNDDIIKSLADALSAEGSSRTSCSSAGARNSSRSGAGAMSSRPSPTRGRPSHTVRRASDDA